MNDIFLPQTVWQGRIPFDALCLVLYGQRVLLREEDSWQPSPDVLARIPQFAELAFALPESAPWHHLGLFDGRPAMCWDEPVNAPGFEWVDVRQLLPVLTPALFSLLSRAMHVVVWSRENRFCGRCGTLMQPHPGGERAMLCSPCNTRVYPRINPCVIVAITRGNDLLLARSLRFTTGMYSAVAGFIEAGESAEQTLHREVEEEVGVRIHSPRYVYSQSWPFSQSLMLGYIAEYASGEIRCQPEEIADANFFSPDNLPPLPPKGSIARALIDIALKERKV